MKGVSGLIAILFLTWFMVPFVKAGLTWLGLPVDRNAVIIAFLVIFFVLTVLFIAISQKQEEKRKEREYEKVLRIREKVERKYRAKNK